MGSKPQTSASATITAPHMDAEQKDLSAQVISAHDGSVAAGWPLPQAAVFLLSMQTRTQRLELILERVCSDLNRTHDMQIVRACLGLSASDVQTFSRLFLWHPEKGGEVSIHSHRAYTTEQYTNSPLPDLYHMGVGARVCLSKGQTGSYGIEADLKDMGATDYIILPMLFHDGIGGHISWATHRDGGWTEEQTEVLHGISTLFSLRADGAAHGYTLQQAHLSETDEKT